MTYEVYIDGDSLTLGEVIQVTRNRVGVCLSDDAVKKMLCSSSWTLLGHFYHGHLKDHLSAEDAYRQAISLDEKDADTWTDLGNLYHYDLKDHQAAKDAYVQAIDIDENHVRSWSELGHLYQNSLHDYRRAKSAYLKAISFDKSYAPPWNGLGNLYQYHLKDYQIAKEAYFQAIDIDGNYALPWGGLGDLYAYHLRDYQRAREAYVRATSLDPGDAVSWNELATLYRDHLHDYAAAREAYLKAIACDANYALAYNGLGALYQDQLHDYPTAREAYLQAVTLDMNVSAPKRNLVWLGIVINDERLISDYLFTVEGENPAMALLEAALSLRKNNVGDALEMLKSVLKEKSPLLWSLYRDDLLRLLAFFYTCNFSVHLLNFLQQNHFSRTLAPLVFAVEAFNEGATYLETIAPEMRPETENIYRCLAALLGDTEKRD